MSSWVRTGSGNSFSSYGYESPNRALEALELDIKARRLNGELWERITKYRYVRSDGLVSEVIFK